MAAPLVRLGALFGALYFLQGLVEPGDGLIAQPTRALLEARGHGAGAIGDATLLAALPWAFKPIYGIVSDALPLLGTHRRSYLALASGIAALALLALATIPGADAGAPLVLCLALATWGVALADVVVDAHMVERARPLGLTGQVQAIQWAAIYLAAALAGAGGGRLSAAGSYHLAFATAAIGALLTLGLTLAAVREPAAPAPRGQAFARLGAGLRALAREIVRPPLPAAIGLLALVSFTPGYGAVLDYHATRGLGLDEAAYGDASAAYALACAAACGVYGLVCRRVAFAALLHASLALGVLAALSLAAIAGERSLLLASAVSGAAYMLATLAQLDLAARVCPPGLAGSVFALLMAAQNLSLSVATWLGGHVYEDLSPVWGARWAYAALALAGAAATACGWLLLPAARRGAALTS